MEKGDNRRGEALLLGFPGSELTLGFALAVGALVGKAVGEAVGALVSKAVGEAV